MKFATLLLLSVSAVSAVSALAARTAAAQPSGAQAETLFRQGKDLMAKGKIAEACAAFDASQKLDPTISTLLNQAACREKNEQYATAWGLFLEAERQTRTATDAPTQQLHQVAANKASKLESRLSTLTINVPNENRIGGLQVLRGGEPVDPGAWNKALPVDGGTYRVSATAPGNTEWSTTVTVAAERDVKAIDIPKLKPAALVPPRGNTPTDDPPTMPESGDQPEQGRSKLPFVVGGGALALGAVAIGFELWARSTYDKAKTEPNNARQESLWNSANTKRYVAEGLGVAALAGAGVAVYLYLREGRGEASAAHASRLQLTPVVASDRAGLVLLGRY